MLSTATIAEYLTDVNFPASKNEILQHAAEKNAPQHMLAALREMPEPPGGKYYSMAGVWNEIVEIE